MTNVQKVRNAYYLRREAQAWLDALRELLELYKERGSYEYGACPLCEVNGDCGECPWRVLTGENCDTYRRKHFPEARTGNFEGSENADTKAYRQLRMRQLPKWIGYYEQALANWRQK